MNDRDLHRASADGFEPDLDLEAHGDLDGPDDDGGAFHDPVLRRALAYAADHGVVPLDETRESIRAFAHEAVAPSLSAAPLASQRNLLQRALGLRGGAGIGAHIPWNAVLAMVVVAAVVVVRDRRSAGDAVPEPAVAATEIAQAPSAPSVTLPSPAASPTDTAPAVDAAPPDQAVAAVPSSSSPAAADPASAPPPVPLPTIGLPTLATPAVETPDDAAARIQTEQKLQRLEAAEAKARLAQQSDAGGLPASLFPSALPRTAIPVEVPRAGRSATTPAAGVPPTSPSAAAGRLEESPPPNFIALSQWTRLTITPAGGESLRVARAEASELGALAGSAALAGVAPGPLAGRVDWRIVFERNGEPLATLETAGSQVRWKENGMPAGTGVPAGNALNSLRQALKEAQAEAAKAVKATEPAAAPPAAPAPSPTPPAPASAPSQPETAVPEPTAAPAMPR